MKANVAVVLVAAMGFAGALLLSGGSAVADSAPVVATCTLATAPMLEEHAYIGGSKCKMCHKAEYDSWEQTVHAKAFDALKPNEAAEAKTKANLDPAKDYTTDEACICCHVTGFGKEGGYAITTDEKEAKKMAKLEGVGCEMCHGPGAGMTEIKKEIKKEKRKYKFEELAALGMLKVDAVVCTTCHNEKSPTYNAEAPFDFEKAKEDTKAIHAHTPLELREE